MRVDVDDLPNPPTLVQKLEPVANRVFDVSAFVSYRRFAEDPVRRIDLEDVDVAEHVRKPAIRLTVAVAVLEQPPGIGGVTCTSLSAPWSQRTSRSIWMTGSGLGSGTPAILRDRAEDQGKGVLVIKRSRCAGQLDANAGGHELLWPRLLGWVRSRVQDGCRATWAALAIVAPARFVSAMAIMAIVAILKSAALITAVALAAVVARMASLARMAVMATFGLHGHRGRPSPG